MKFYYKSQNLYLALLGIFIPITGFIAAPAVVVKAGQSVNLNPKEELANPVDGKTGGKILKEGETIDENELEATTSIGDGRGKGFFDRLKFGPEGEKKSIADHAQWRVDFFTYANQYNNGDLRKLDETNDASIDLTDDRLTFVYSGVMVYWFLPLSEDLAFNLSLFKNGLWGHDQLGGRDTTNNGSQNRLGANVVAFGPELNTELYIYRNKKTIVSMVIGRQPFSIGGLKNDYMMDDVLDAVTLQFIHHLVGKFNILAFDYFWSGSKVNEVNYGQYMSGDDEKVDNFDGDVNTIRYGLSYSSSNFLKWGQTIDPVTDRLKIYTQLRTYAFLSDYGAGNEGGSDRTNLGATGNFADNDNVTIMGIRPVFNMDLLYFFTDLAVSRGIDRKAKGYKGKNVDVDSNGAALNIGVELYPLDFDYLKRRLPAELKNFSTKISLDFFQATGDKFDKSGTQTSHGFVSFKGAQVGGLLLNQYYGMHPTAYTDDDGIDDWPHDKDRKSGTRFFHVGWDVGFQKKYFVGTDAWFLKDMGESDIKTVIHRADKAQKRLGKDLGKEWDWYARYHFDNNLKFQLLGGIFWPGPFYETIGLVETAPQGNQKAWGVQLGSQLSF